MAEIGMSMEVPRMNLAEKIGSLFSRRLAEKRWIQNHAEQIQMYAKVAQSMPESERAKIYAKVEYDMQKDTNKSVVKNRWILGLSLAALTFAGTLIKIPQFRELIGRAQIGKIELGKPFKKFGELGEKKLGQATGKVQEWFGEGKRWLNGLLHKNEATPVVSRVRVGGT